VFAVKAFEVVEVYLQIFLISVLDGVSGQLHALDAVCPVKQPMVLTEYEALRAPGWLVCFGVQKTSFLQKIEQDSLVVQAVT